jgi:tetratricopeptide (TPR) repeat protein
MARSGANAYTWKARQTTAPAEASRRIRRTSREGASMSRHRLPRRLSQWFSAFAAGAFIALAAPGAAHAQDAVARTLIGGHRNLAACGRLAGQGDFSDRALTACTRALSEELSSEDRLGVLVNRGVIEMRRHDNEAALADFDAAVAIDPRNPEAHVNRGAALVQMQRPGPAVAALTQALSLGVSEPYKAYYNRGAAREALGDLRGAYEDFSTALEIHPDWAPAEAEVQRFVRARHDHLAQALAQEGVATPQ